MFQGEPSSFGLLYKQLLHSEQLHSLVSSSNIRLQTLTGTSICETIREFFFPQTMNTLMAVMLLHSRQTAQERQRPLNSCCCAKVMAALNANVYALIKRLFTDVAPSSTDNDNDGDNWAWLRCCSRDPACFLTFRDETARQAVGYIRSASLDELTTMYIHVLFTHFSEEVTRTAERLVVKASTVRDTLTIIAPVFPHEEHAVVAETSLSHSASAMCTSEAQQLDFLYLEACTKGSAWDFDPMTLLHIVACA